MRYRSRLCRRSGRPGAGIIYLRQRSLPRDYLNYRRWSFDNSATFSGRQRHRVLDKPRLRRSNWRECFGNICLHRSDLSTDCKPEQRLCHCHIGQYTSPNQLGNAMFRRQRLYGCRPDMRRRWPLQDIVPWYWQRGHLILFRYCRLPIISATSLRPWPLRLRECGLQSSVGCRRMYDKRAV